MAGKDGRVFVILIMERWEKKPLKQAKKEKGPEMEVSN